MEGGHFSAEIPQSTDRTMRRSNRLSVTLDTHVAINRWKRNHCIPEASCAFWRKVPPGEEGEKGEKPDANDPTPENSESEEDTETRDEPHQTPPRHSTRIRRAPRRLQDYVQY
ncbi:putative occludin [Trichinella spiralis]|uniref:putative occludin n=1 Tax=Trichinella spiralis TaxID=6334 RepID=UPI0001EFD3CD|nr:putative occludin [Trichinella spiralis]